MLHKIELFIIILASLLALVLFGLGLHYIGGTLIICLIGYLLIWNVPKYQVKKLDNKPSGRKLTQFEREEKRLKLEDDTRKTIAQIVGGALLLAGLFLTFRTYQLGTDNYRLGLEQQKITSRGQITERFNKAVEHLGNQDLAIRLGGLYALEQILKDSPEEHQTIIEVLSAYIREKSKRKVVNQQENAQSNTAKLTPEQIELTTTDVQTALTILGRRPRGVDRKEDRINFENVNLTYANLAQGNFANANLRGVNLSYAALTETIFNSADLTGANLTNATLTEADLSNATLDWTVFRNAKLFNINLNNAHFSLIQLGNVKFLMALELQQAKFDYIRISNAILGDNVTTGIDEKLNKEAALERAKRNEKLHTEFQNSVKSLNEKLKKK